MRFAPYQLIEILLFCQSTWRGVGSATKGTDRLVCRVRFRDPFTSLSGIRVCILLFSPRAFSSSVLPPLSVTPSPHHSFLISHFSDPVMSKGVEGGGSSAASALQRQRRGFREARRDPRTAVDPRTADVGA